MPPKYEFEEKPIYNAVTVYRERGNYLQRLEQFEKSIVAYNEALRWNDSDIHSLLGRSLARAKATHYLGALADAARAAELEPNNFSAMQIKAHTEYEKGEFEKALVLAHRGQRLRRLPPDFADCARVATETVRECAGKTAHKVLTAAIPLLERVELKRETIDEYAPAITYHQSRMAPNPTHKVQEMSFLEKQKADHIARVMASKYLERMAHDKYFLKALCKDERLNSANKQGSKLLRELAEKALNDIERRQISLRERRPLYAARASEQKAKERLSRKRKEQLSRAQKQHIKDAKRLISAAFKFMEKRDTAKCLENAHFAMEQISRKPASLLPGKDKFLQDLYDIVAKAFLDQKSLTTKRISESDLEKRAYVLLGIMVSREPSHDSVLRARPPAPPRDVKLRLRMLERSLMMSSRVGERCYLLHELARHSLDIKAHAKARFYSLKCQIESRAGNQRAWLLNACFLLARCHIQSNNRPEARSVLLEAASLSKTYGMGEIFAFFDTCVNVCVEGEVAAAEESVEKRERDMVSLMQDSDLKAAAQQLFKKMAVLPAARRFSVMPGRIEEAPSTPAGRRMSIIPKAQGQAQPGVIKKRHLPLGLQEFDI